MKQTLVKPLACKQCSYFYVATGYDTRCECSNPIAAATNPRVPGFPRGLDQYAYYSRELPPIWCPLPNIQNEIEMKPQSCRRCKYWRKRIRLHTGAYYVCAQPVAASKTFDQDKFIELEKWRMDTDDDPPAYCPLPSKAPMAPKRIVPLPLRPKASKCNVTPTREVVADTVT